MPQLSGRFSRLFGNRPFYQEVIAVALPMAFQYLVANSMGFIDSIMVGRIGEQAIAGVAVSNKCFFILQVALVGLCGGFGIFISQYFGARDHEKGQGLFIISAMATMVMAGIFVLLMSVFPRPILSLFVSDPVTVTAGLDYLKYVKFSFLPLAFNLAAGAALRSVGQTRWPLLIGGSAILLNTGLNVLLIFGNLGLPALGVAGAGLATLIARGTESLLYTVLLTRGRQYFTLKIRPIRHLSGKIMRQVARKTSVLITSEILWATGMTILFWAFCQIGEEYIPSLNIVDTINNFLFVIFNGLGPAVSVLVGARLGAGQFSEARNHARWLLSFAIILSLSFGLLVLVLSGQIPLLFNYSDDIRTMASTLLRLQVIFYTMLSLNTTIYLLLRIGGDMKGTMLMDGGYMWVVAIPLAVALSLWVRPSIIVFFLSVQAFELIKMPITVYLYKRGRWVVNLT